MNENELLQAVRQVVREEIKGLKDEVADLRGDMTGLKDDVSDLKDEVADLRGDMTGLKDDVSDLKDGAVSLKEEVAGQGKRLARVETLLEHEIPRQIQLLAEGHKAILERLPEKDDTGDLRSRVSTLETVVAAHSARLSEL